MGKTFADFVEDLKDDAILARHGPDLGLLDVGDYPGLVAFGKDRGYAFTADDVRTFLKLHLARRDGGEARSSHVHATAARAYLEAWLAS